MSKKLSKIWKYRWIWRSIFKTVYFNLHYLPFSQAIKLPILLYKPKFKSLKGTVKIDGHVKTGMIQLGMRSADIFPNTGIIFENHGGSLIFKGEATVTNGTSLTVGQGATLTLGHKFMANAGSKIICYHHISFGDKCRVAWETMIMDTDFHTLLRPDGSHSRGYAPINIGEGCWIGTRCMILKGTELPSFTTVQAMTTLNAKYDIPPKSVIGTSAQIAVKATDTYRELGNDKIIYPYTQ